MASTQQMNYKYENGDIYTILMLNLKIKHEKQELYEIYFFRLTLAFCFPEQ